jgi:hypothetical protein
MDERREKILTMTEQQFRIFVDDQLRAGSGVFEAHQKLLEQSMELTQQTANNTREIVDLFGTSKKGLALLQAFGAGLNRTARWAAPILMVAGAIWAIMHGQWPKGGE